MKVRSKVYKDIRDRLKAAMPQAHIDLQKGQLANPANNYPIPLPACFVELKEALWSNAIGEQIGEMTVSVYLYLSLVTDSFYGAELEDEAIELSDRMDELFETLQGFSTENFSPLNRVSDTVEEYQNRHICYRIDFHTTIYHKYRHQLRINRPNLEFNN